MENDAVFGSTRAFFQLAGAYLFECFDYSNKSLNLSSSNNPTRTSNPQKFTLLTVYSLYTIMVGKNSEINRANSK